MTSTEKGIVSKEGTLFSPVREFFRRRKAKKIAAAAAVEIRLTQSTEDRIAYSETEFAALQAAAETDVIIAENSGEKRMIRVYHVDPEIGFDNRRMGTRHMVSKDNLNGLGKGLGGK